MTKRHGNGHEFSSNQGLEPPGHTSFGNDVVKRLIPRDINPDGMARDKALLLCRDTTPRQFGCIQYNFLS